MDNLDGNQKSIPAGSYFEPDILCGHQYFKIFSKKSHCEPEENLMFAVLSDAIECFQKYSDGNSQRTRKLFNDAEAWIACREYSGPFSFEHICEVLNLDPNYLRLGLMRWRASQSRKIPRKRMRQPLRYRNRLKQSRVCV